MDGRDSAFGTTIEVGQRVTFAASPAVRPYVAVRYTTVLGYDAFIRRGYAGPSVAIGISTGSVRE